MNRKQYVFSILKENFRRSLSPTKEDRPFLLAFNCGIGLFALVAFIFLFTGRPLFAWLMYATMGMTGGVGIAALIWRFKDIAQQIKGDP